jgi:hypothetical protein
MHPGPRFSHVIAYDESSEGTLLFGGLRPDGVPLGDTWAWDGNSWHRAATEGEGPTPRKWSAMAYDARRQRMILFGGLEGMARTGSSQGDTWEWDGTTWRLLTSVGPPRRDHHQIVYDRMRDKVVLFGGYDGSDLIGDTWEWDGTAWERIDVTGPCPRAAHGMAYDEAREVVVLFGGRTLEAFFDDTWLWDGETWLQKDASGPRNRAMHGMTYASASKQILLYGGRDASERLGDTWSWDGKGWEQLSQSGPSKRGVYSMAYDRGRCQAILYGGGYMDGDEWHLYEETWLWSESTWRQMEG